MPPRPVGVEDVDGQVLARQSLRFLYRILFLLYAEASPEMGVLPVGAGEYNEGYGLDRLRELTLVNIQSPESRRGTHIYESLAQLFHLVDNGHAPAGANPSEDASGENEGLLFQPLKADLFHDAATSLINGTKLSKGKVYCTMELEVKGKKLSGGADGIRADVDGNIWASAGWAGEGFDGVHVFAPDGARIGLILLPEICSNVCFGGTKRNRLFIVSTSSLYSILLMVNGAKTF